MATESRVLIDKLDNHNWGIWRRKFRALLLSKRLGGVIDGTDEDKDNSSQVLGLIQLHLSDAYHSMADDVATAKALWDKLEATFTAQNNARRLLLRQELNSLKKAPTESIAEFAARAKELATNLEAVGHKPEDSEVSLSLCNVWDAHMGSVIPIATTAVPFCYNWFRSLKLVAVTLPVGAPDLRNS